MHLLLHICCAVCACSLVEKFREAHLELAGYFYNPNIHPYLEFTRRLRAVEVLAEQERFKVYYERKYGLLDYLKRIIGNEDQRCSLCYEMRLRKTAEFARQQGFDHFSTTLIISPYQNQLLIKTIGQKVAEEIGVSFYYQLFTDLYNISKKIATSRGLYRQQYCGCIFSEYERYSQNDNDKE